MVSLSPEPAQPNARSQDPCSAAGRISFSADFLDEREFISIIPDSKSRSTVRDHHDEAERGRERGKEKMAASEFEFLSGNNTTMLSTADELFFEGKLLPFWQVQNAERVSLSLSKINIKQGSSNNYSKNIKDEKINGTEKKEERNEKVPTITSFMKGQDHNQHQFHHHQQQQQPARIWYIDDDPSPRPPKCTVLWKELLRLKKNNQRVAAASTISPSSSSSSSSSSSCSMAKAVAMDEEKKADKEKHTKRVKSIRGFERSRSGSIRIRPMVNVPTCIQGRKSSSSSNSSSFPPLFPLQKGKT